MNTVIKSRYSAEYSKVEPALPGRSASWLVALRAGALDKFSGSGFPSIREEEWRYTNVSGIEKNLFVPTDQPSSGSVDKEWLDRFKLPDCWSFVLVDGYFSAELSQLEGMPEGLVVQSLAKTLDTDAEQVKPYFAQAVSDDEHSFVAFNTAWFCDGLFLKVSKKLALIKPVQLLHVTTQQERLSTTRTVIVVEPMAEAQVIETYIGIEQAYLSAAVTEVFVEANANLTLYKVQCESAKAYHFGGTYVKQARDARFIHHNFAFGGLLARCDIHCDLDNASECDLNGLYLGNQRQHLDNHTRINHLQPNAVSREMYKGVLAGRSRGVFQGRVVVAENAQKTDSQMNNRNLLLSDDAEADTKPQLEIYADDVKCSHGVTVGQLDEKSVFYLQSRCVDEETARNMLTFAFANEMVNKLTIKSLHDLVLTQVLERFPQQGISKDWL
jgi:Fe-S cluster assembly protein SufD